MEYLRIHHVTKRYGPRVLFENIELTISKGDKIALIAKNGSGKSTLLRIIAGETPSDGDLAEIFLNPSIKLAYLPQNPGFQPDKTILEVLYDTTNPTIVAYREYLQALEENDAMKLEKCAAKVDQLHAWDVDARIKEILFKLDLQDLEKPVYSLSGGQVKRLALAKLILEQADFIILDEPTNHLDIDMIEWLEDYLQKSTLTLFMVTHDRYFMERICNQMVELDRGELVWYSGNYSAYLLKKSLLEEQHSATMAKAKKRYLRELAWMRRQPQARTTKAKSRIQEFDTLKAELSEISFDPIFEIPIECKRLGKKILELYDVSKTYGDQNLIEGFWYKFNAGEKVGIAGPNGSGKSTLAKIISGEVPPDSGKRVIGETVSIAHYRQDGYAGREDIKIIDAIREIAEYIPLKKGIRMTAEKLLENFMFSREQQEVYVSELSGGEKKRLHLLRILMSNPNFLILDEPTNDLDVLSLHVLENYLERFPGCAVIISHDRFFLDKLIDHLFIMSGNGRVVDYLGTYSEWKAETKDFSVSKKAKKKKKNKSSQAETRPLDQSRKLSYLEKKELKQLEADIQRLEIQKEELSLKFADSDLSPDRIEELSVRIASIAKEIDEMESRWLELSEFL